MGYKKFLQQYTDLQAEIKDLETRIRKLEAQKDKIVHDSVTGSDAEFPYTEKHFHIQGIDERRRRRLKRLRKLLWGQKEECEDMKIEIEKFIATIPDSKKRRVFRYRYLDNMTWQAIAFKIGRHDESYPRKIIHDKYLENPKNPNPIC